MGVLLLSVSEALNNVLKAITPVGTEQVPLIRASGRVLAKPVEAPYDLPSFANSSMDGFAVHSSDIGQATIEQPVELSVIGDASAGSASEFRLLPGQAIRIMTGAVIPEGADAVLPVEETDQKFSLSDSELPANVQAYKSVKPGENIRPTGQDVRRGEIFFDPGSRLRPQDIGLLAMFGLDSVTVYRHPRVSVLSTGDELLPVGTPLRPGMIYDSNTYALTSLVEQYGGEVIKMGIIQDREEAVTNSLDQAVNLGADLIVSSAGVSVGAFDYVRKVVEEHGKLNFWRVNMRPGKPLVFGIYRDVPLIGLPGNPVSAFVGFEIFVRPAIIKLSGQTSWERPRTKVILEHAIESDGRESYLRAVVTRQQDNFVARLTGHQGSGNLRSLVQANAFLIVPSEVKSLPTGAVVEAWIVGEVGIQ